MSAARPPEGSYDADHLTLCADKERSVGSVVSLWALWLTIAGKGYLGSCARRWIDNALLGYICAFNKLCIYSSVLTNYLFIHQITRSSNTLTGEYIS